MQAISGLFGGGGANKAAADAAQQTAVAATRQQGLAQEEQARVDLQAGKVTKTPRGRRLLLDGDQGGSDLSRTVG